jgi:hypothetical protein
MNSESKQPLKELSCLQVIYSENAQSISHSHTHEHKNLLREKEVANNKL